MDRETFKTLAAGKFAMSHIEDTISKDRMIDFMDGAVFAFDQLNKTKAKGGQVDNTQSNSTKETTGQDGYHHVQSTE